MKNNKNKSKKILILFAVIMLIIISFFFLYKSQYNKINIKSKNENTIKSEELDKKDGKTPEGNDTNPKGEDKGNETSATNKEPEAQVKDKTTEATNAQEGITAFVKAANFGSTVELIIDSSSFNSSYKYYQFFIRNKAISNIEDIAKTETTIYPAEEAGSEVILRLLDENKKVLKELKIKLQEKK